MKICFIVKVRSTIINNMSEMICQSKALYSSWFFHQPSNTLFDAGEGCATYLGNKIYAIDRICISHGHGDHVLGLPSLIGCRNCAAGDKSKELAIYYPEDSWSILELKEFIEKRNSNLKYKLEWFPIKSGQGLSISKSLSLVSFPLKHQRNGTTLGYKLVESRVKLLPEYIGQNIPEVLKTKTKEEIQTVYQQNVFSYCLDAYELNPGDILNSSIAILDCTFLNEEDREDDTHMSLNDVKNLIKEANIKKAYAAHISGRYNEIPVDVDNIKFLSPYKVHRIERL